MPEASREFRVPPLIVTGAGCASNVGAVLRDRGYARALVIADPTVGALPSTAGVLDGLRQAGVEVSLHDGVTGEPTLRMVEAALAAHRQTRPDVVVGLGGGSVMDTAKAVAILATNAGPLPRYEGADKVPEARAPLVCIATTAGTGSEVTRYTIITDEARDRKMLISSWQVLPDVAVVDPDLTLGLPPRPTVSTGVDALTHAIEAYVSRRSQPLSDSLALSAIRRIGGALRRAYRQPGDREARAAMSLAALEAGMAFCNASVALVHGMARPLGAYFGVPHGLANATLLARVTAFSAPAAPERYREIALALGEPVGSAAPEAGAQAAVEAIDRLCADLDVPPLGALGVAAGRFQEVVEQMAQDALASGSPGNNPRVPSAEEIVTLYRACY